MKRLVLVLAIAAAAFGADITGTWNFDVETDMGSGNPVMTFEQKGDVLTGTYRGQLGESPLTGKVNGDKVEFWFEVSPAGDKMKVVYTGTVSGATMQGSVDLAGQVKGTFKAKKQ